MRRYALFLSLRYLHARTLNIICVLAVAFSVMVLIVVLTVLWGFDHNIRASIRGTLSDITVEGNWKIGKAGISDYAAVQERLKSVPGVVATAPYIEQKAMIRHGGLSDVAMVRGIVMPEELRVSDISTYVKRGHKTPSFNRDDGELMEYPGLIAGSAFFEILALIDGETVRLVSPWSDVREVPMKFTVIGKFATGMYQYDRNLVYIPLAAAQEAFGMGDQADGISVALDPKLADDYIASDALRDRVQEMLGDWYRVETWRDRQKNFLAALVLERHVTTVIAGFLFVLAAATIAMTQYTAVREKTRDIGILRSIGGRSRGIMSIFLMNGLAIGLLGSAIGLGAGLLFSYNVNTISDLVFGWTGFRVFPPDVYPFTTIPTYMDAWGIAMILCVATSISLLAAILPAIRAARLDPVEALRYE